MPEIALALDVPGREPALELVDALGAEGRTYKVGLELYGREGPSIMDALRDRGARIFLDLKLHDIPTTVGGAARAAAAHGADFLTVHASGGSHMVEAAAEAAGEGTAVLAVTVLTSLSGDDLAAIWGRDRPEVRAEVARLAELAVTAGAAGVVASVREAADLRKRLGPNVLIATPGIRRAGDGAHDQARVATPADAVRAGADLLVVGRTVTAAPDPRAALRAVEDEVRRARATERVQ